MENLTTEQELISVKAQIVALQLKETELTEKLMSEAKSFIEKFRLWWKDDNQKCHEKWIISPGNFPLLRKLFDNFDERNRGEIYTLEDLIGEDDFCILTGDYDETFEVTDQEVEDIIKMWEPHLQEAMKGKMKSFKCDW